jgi:glycosyltransferase involved in cell wall biosynthesis
MIVVSTPTCEIPRYIKHNHNGILCKDKKSFNLILKDILKNKNKYIGLGRQSRIDIKKTAPIDLFINNWNNVFKKVIL